MGIFPWILRLRFATRRMTVCDSASLRAGSSMQDGRFLRERSEAQHLGEGGSVGLRCAHPNLCDPARSEIHILHNEGI